MYRKLLKIKAYKKKTEKILNYMKHTKFRTENEMNSERSPVINITMKKKPYNIHHLKTVSLRLKRKIVVFLTSVTLE